MTIFIEWSLKKFKGMAAKKKEIFGIFRRGGFSSKVNFLDHFFETIKIRLNIKQNKFWFW